jgi:histidinol-phosphate phosphatase family protein
MKCKVVNREPPTQAVILAGGSGTRLKPITDTRPKAMVEILGKPFLAYQIEQLRDQGFRNVVLLLGYLPEVIQNYFGDGSDCGIKIDYSVSAVTDETARRLKIAETLLDPHFLLLYCDNYWPMNIDKMWAQFSAHRPLAMITVYTNRDGYTRNNVCVDSEGFVTVYDKSNSTPGLQGVEISYALMDRSVVTRIPEQNISVEEALYLPLVRDRHLAAFMTDHRYYSVGSLDRLPLTELFLSRQPTVILDRDGVLNRKPPRAQYVSNWHEFHWLPGAQEALRLLKQTGHRVIIVSNQAGIARGVMTETDLKQIHSRMRVEVEEAGGRIDEIYYCPHDWNDGCDCRKPSPGLLFQAQRDLSLDLSRTVFLGDDARDGEAAERAGCPFLRVSEEKGLLECVQQFLNSQGNCA